MTCFQNEASDMTCSQNEISCKIEEWDAGNVSVADPGSGRPLGNGNRELLSEGSRYHQAGRCKPCVFFHTRGCQNGTSCKFCHECPPNESQRRKRVKRNLVQPFLAARQKSDGASVTSYSTAAGGSDTSSRLSHSRQSSAASSIEECTDSAALAPALAAATFPNVQATTAGMWPSIALMPQNTAAPGMCSLTPVSQFGVQSGQPDAGGGAVSQGQPQYMWVQVAMPVPAGGQQPQQWVPYMCQPQQY